MVFKTTKGGGALSHSLSKKDKPTEADIAYEVLKSQGNPMHYQILIEEVLQRLGISKEAVRIAEALTKINLDTRFTFHGRGEWGLKVWEPPKATRRSSAITLMNKIAEDEEDDDNKLDVDAEDLEYDPLDEDSLDSEEEDFAETSEAQSEEKW
ncbi:DNA-directed RNA polymerase, delta subunit [Desulfosporosinus acidiphilus SJ4]|uniref:RNAP delta factor n=1 Tax=Desulfosporosinus acidiphilus (strain DSM 22704 / JCM 16185 / SJ4) TaxID=646529 RepID=I4DCG5_DESAJ|nr:DNA-directed RNA polymerase subunit delta [Desulfosporosinus acidiphilus]AFM43489.1 DNA-directed RNA polymerase, delta subunit [Desulfosporosinus acidiphilus SJ4]